MRKILIFLTDPVKTYYEKGEVKERYYNPLDLFDEVHMISFCDEDIAIEKVRTIGGNAQLCIHAVGRLRLFSIIRVLNRIHHLIDRVRPDVIRAYDFSIRGTIAVWFGRRFKIPSAISMHIEPDEQRRFDRRPLLRIRKIFENYSVKKTDCVMCVTGHVAEYARRHRARRVEVLYNRVHLDLFQRQASENVFRRKTVLSVARFDRQKRQDYLIKAIKNLDMDLALVGEGPCKENLKKLAEATGVGGKVLFLGSIPNDELWRYYSSCHIFAIASDYEGFCIPLIEAMASGKSIVASDVPAIREVVGEAGILVANDESSFADALARIEGDPHLRDSLASKAKSRSGIFSSSVLEKKERSIYESICWL